MMTGAVLPADRVDASRKYAKLHGLIYVPCFRRNGVGPDAPFLPTPLDAPEAIKLLICARHVPPDAIERWWKGERLEQLRLSLCVHCRCNPVANAAGECWWCERRPWICEPDPLSVPPLADYSPERAIA